MVRRPPHTCDDVANTPASLSKPKSNASEWSARPGEERRMYSFSGRRRSSSTRSKVDHVRESDGDTGLSHAATQSRSTSALRSSRPGTQDHGSLGRSSVLNVRGYNMPSMRGFQGANTTRMAQGCVLETPAESQSAMALSVRNMSGCVQSLS